MSRTMVNVSVKGLLTTDMQTILKHPFCVVSNCECYYDSGFGTSVEYAPHNPDDMGSNPVAFLFPSFLSVVCP